RFGEIEFNIFGERWSVPGNPEIVVLSNITEGGRPTGVRRGGEHWHSDMCYTARPPRGTILYAIEVPELHGLRLGDTEFASAAAAWDALPDAMKRSLEGRRAVFDFRGRKRALTPTQAEIDRNPPVRHPIVRTHPRTGRKCLYVMRDDCTGIDGIEPDEAEALIAALADHIVKPAFVYRHQWRPGDVLMWAYSMVQHRALQNYDTALAQCPELARPRHRRRDGGGDGQGRRRRRDLHLRLFHVPLRRELCGGSATGSSRPVRPRQAGRSGRSGGGRCHRRLEEDAGHGRHPDHDDERSGAQPTRPGSRPDPARRRTARLPGQHALLGQRGRGCGAHRPPPRHAIHHRPSGHHAAANATRPTAAMDRSGEESGPRQGE